MSDMEVDEEVKVVEKPKSKKKKLPGLKIAIASHAEPQKDVGV